MATCTFTRLWLNPATALNTGVGFRLAADGLESDPQVDVTLNTYAGGRVRAITGPQRTHQVPVTLRCDTRTQVHTLEKWQGTLVCARDPKGRKFYATYSDLKVVERPGQDSATATLTLQEVSHSEAV